jgi:hypothetical protein
MALSKHLTLRPDTLPRRALTSAEFSQLADVPTEREWFANIDNPHTRRAYRYLPTDRELIIVRVLRGARDAAAIAEQGGFKV